MSYEQGKTIAEHGPDAARLALEAIADKLGMADTLGLLMEVCQGKAEHLRANWQDANAACQWERVANKLDVATEEALHLP